jgi:hypothetical protein
MVSEHEPLEESSERYLSALYDATEGKLNAACNPYELGDELGYDRDLTDRVWDYLDGEQLTESSASLSIELTHAGIKHVRERLQIQVLTAIYDRDPDGGGADWRQLAREERIDGRKVAEATRVLAQQKRWIELRGATNVHITPSGRAKAERVLGLEKAQTTAPITINANQSPVQFGSHQSHQTVVYHNDTNREVLAFAQDLIRQLPELGLAPAQMVQVACEAQKIQTALESGTPDPNVLQRSLASLKQAFEDAAVKATTGIASSQLQEWGEKLKQLLETWSGP